MLADLGLADALDHRLHLALLRRVDVELDARVEILDVLADHHEVDVAARRGHAGVGLRGPEIRVEVELLAQRDVHRAEAGPELRRERALQRDAVAAHGLERILGEGRAVLRHRGHADVVDIPLDLHAGRFDGTACGLDDFRARAVARDERDGVRQHRLPKTSARPEIVSRTITRRRRPDTRGPATRRGLSLMAQSVGLTSAIRSGMSFAASGVPRPVTASQPIDAE